MSTEQWYYKVSIVIGSAYDDIEDPEFRFGLEEKDKMMSFIDICIENGHEVKIVQTRKEFDNI